MPIAVLCIASAAFSQWLVELKTGPEWLAASVSALVTCGLVVLVSGGIFLTREDRRGLRDRIPCRNAKGSHRESLFGVE
jgi:hypothetical protein